MFVFADAQALKAHVELADRELDGRLGAIGLPAHEWWHPEREHIYFALEEELHRTSLRCFRLPALPRRMRDELGEHQPLVRECRMLRQGMATDRR